MRKAGSNNDAGTIHVVAIVCVAALFCWGDRAASLVLADDTPSTRVDRGSYASDNLVATLIGVPATTTPAKQGISLLTNKEFDKALELASNMIQTSPNDPAGYILQGGAYMGKNDYPNARKSFEKALSVQPDNKPALMNLAQLDLQQKDFESARKRYQAILARDAKDVPAMMGMAQVEANKHNEKAGLAWLEKAKDTSPNALAPRLYLGVYYLRMKNNAMALSELTAAQRDHPANPDVLNLLGQVQLADGQKSQAASTFEKLVAMRPESPAAHYHLAMARINTDNPNGGAESLRKALQLKPDYAEAVYALAKLEIRAGRPEEALKLAQQFEKAAPKSPAGFIVEGDVLFAQQRYTDAVAAYEKAWGLQQASPTVLKLHAAYTKAGNAKAADAKIQAWLKGHPDDVPAQMYLAGEDLREGRNKLAIERYEAILKKSPENVLALNNLAQLYQQEKDPRALATAERAQKLAPDSARVSDTLGWILVEQGKTKRGLELLQKAAASAPQVPEIRYHLAVALAKSGDKTKARKELESLLQSDPKFAQREAAEQLLKQL